MCRPIYCIRRARRQNNPCRTKLWAWHTQLVWLMQAHQLLYLHLVSFSMTGQYHGLKSLLKLISCVAWAKESSPSGSGKQQHRLRRWWTSDLSKQLDRGSFIMEAKRGRRSQTEPPRRSTVMNHRREERRSPAQVERLSETWRDFWGSCRSGTRWGRGDESRRWLAVREARTPVLTSLDGAGPLTPCTPAMTRLFCMSTSLICPPPACWWDQVMLTLRASTCTRTLACLDYPVKRLLLSLWPWLGLSLRCKKNKPWIFGEGCQRGSENKSIHSEGH